MPAVPEFFACKVFDDKVMRARLPEKVYKSLRKTIDNGTTLDPAVANTVAAAMCDWAVENGATHFTHWFQPMTGITAEKHDGFLSPAPDGRVIMELTGKELIKGEPDASSFPSGGLRATFEARGYTAWDPSSYAFIKEKTLCIPTAFCSYGGEALDKKTPLLRSMEALNRQALRILKLFGGTEVKRVVTNVGPEQEYFLVDREMYLKRKDLIYTGRTLFGAKPPKGQELEDHYFGAIKPRVQAYMEELNEELWKLGVDSMPRFTRDTTDRNRTSPFAFTGNKFEFRMVGSSDSIACANIMINASVAESLRQFADDLEGAADFDERLHTLIKETYIAHKRIIFNGNGYDDAWIREATEQRGLLNLRTTADALPRLLEQKNIDMLTCHGIFSEAELRSRYEIQLENYVRTVRIEALTMADMARKEIIPAMAAFTAALADGAAKKMAVGSELHCGYETKLIRKLSCLTDAADAEVEQVEKAVTALDALGDVTAEAALVRDEVLPKMASLRAVCDEAETVTAASYWPFPTYGDLLFGV